MLTYHQNPPQMLINGVGVHPQLIYAGHGPGLNNPAMQNVKGIGPLPKGQYKIVQWDDYHGALGAMVAILVAYPTNLMFGRSLFRIHGDNSAANYTASDGCIVMDHVSRQKVRDSHETILEVV